MIGLIQAFLLLEQESIRKVVVINADVMSRKTSPKDRNSYPLDRGRRRHHRGGA